MQAEIVFKRLMMRVCCPVLAPAAGLEWRLSRVFLRKRLLLSESCQALLLLQLCYRPLTPSHAEGTSLDGIGCARSSASVYPSSLLLFCRSEWEVSGYNTADYISVSPQMTGFIFPSGVMTKLAFKTFFYVPFFTFKIACIDLKYNIEQPLSSTALKMEISANMFHHVLLRTSRRMLSRKSGRWLSRCQDGSHHLLFCKYNLFCLEKCVLCLLLEITYGIKLSENI